MKKLIILSLLISINISFGQELNKTSSIDELLQRLDANGNTALTEPEDLFSESEKQSLQAHFSQQIPFSNTLKVTHSIYAYDVRDSKAFGEIEKSSSYEINPMSNFDSELFAGDLTIGANKVELYGILNDTKQAVLIDQTNGERTVIGILENLKQGHNITSLAWNQVNQKMYASSTNGEITTIYEFKFPNSLIPIGDTLNNSLGIWLAIDNDGLAYMADVVDDNLYSIDLRTGKSTQIGPLGMNINFAQGADFDPETNTLYMAAYLGAGINHYASVDTNTGMATSLGSINSDTAEVTMLTIMGTPPEIPSEPSEPSQETISSAMLMYPNPASTFVNLKNTTNTSYNEAVIYNMSGTVVLNSDLRKMKLEQKINVSNLPSGIYIMKIYGEKETITKKLIIK